MNQTCSTWLPPDGDVRLVRFQQDVARSVGLPDGLPGPGYLGLLGRTPTGRLVCGDWTHLEGEPVLEAHDSQGLVGYFHLALGGARPWENADLSALPPAPEWAWNRGVLADLTCEDSDASFVLWSWSNRRGWKADSPKA